jgi:hypothetical protein
MKKLQISVLSLLLIGGLFTNEVVAQKGAYGNINLGYNFSLNSDVVGVNSTTTSGESNTFKNEVVTGSFGAGLNFGGTFGYMFSDNLGAELGVNYLMGSSFDATDNHTYTDAIVPANNYQQTTTSSISASMIQFNPSIVISAGKTEGLNPYGKFGFVFGMGTITEEESVVKTGSGAYTQESTQEFGEGMALGFSAAFGATYSFSEKLGLFGEFNMINMSYAPTKGEYTTHTTDGVDDLADATTNDKEIIFEDSLEGHSGAPTEDSQPREALKTYYSFSSLGIKIGLRFQF